MLVDDDSEGSGEGSRVLRIMGLGSLGAGVSGFGSSFTSGFTSALGVLELNVMGVEVTRCRARSRVV